MLISRWFPSLFALLVTASVGMAQTAQKPIRLLLVTDSGGFVHDSVGHAEDVLKTIGPKNGIEVTCYRFTRDPDQKVTVEKTVDGKKMKAETTILQQYSDNFRARTGKIVEKENCGRVNAETLKKFDCVLFFTTGNPLTDPEIEDLVTWVKNGGAYAGTHCATDTLYPNKNRKWNEAYGELVGAYFVNHPWHKKIKLKNEDPKHAAGMSFENGAEITDEIYQFRDTPYSRDRLHIILSVDNSSIGLKDKGVVRKDEDFAIAWCQEFGKGRSFYTSLGHRKEVWSDERFQKHLLAGIKWTVRQAEGDATPSNKLKK